jgi:hypothetical protein
LLLEKQVILEEIGWAQLGHHHYPRRTVVVVEISSPLEIAKRDFREDQNLLGKDEKKNEEIYVENLEAPEIFQCRIFASDRFCCFQRASHGSRKLAPSPRRYFASAGESKAAVE